MKRRGGHLRRIVETRDPRPKCIVVCEGQRTEPDYLNAFQTRFPKALFRIESVTGVGAPKTLLSRALDEKRTIKRALKKSESFRSQDQIWIAFDKDEHPEIAQTIYNARANDIGVAFSNPCFELWLILHVQDYGKTEDRHAIQKRCQSCVDGYDRTKGKSGDFLKLIDNLEEAERRGQSLCEQRVEEGRPNSRPSTTFWELTKALRKT